MKKLLLAALAGLSLFAAEARATVYYVNSAVGRDVNSGTSAAAPKKTLPAFKTLALPGDAILAYPGSYTWTSFDSAGSNPTGNGFITVKGVTTTADALTDSTARARIVISASVEPPGQSYISLKGVTITSSLHFGENADRDSVQLCTVTGDLEIYGGDYDVVRFNIFTGSRIGIASYSDGSQTSAVGDVVDYNHFWRLGAGVLSQPHFVEMGKNPSSGPGSFCDSLTFTRNRIYAALDPNASDVSPWYMYRTRRSNFRHNYWEIRTDRAAGSQWAMRMRDSSYTDLFRGDTLIAYGVGQLNMGPSTHGGDTVVGLEVWGCTMDSCFYNLSACQNGSGFLFQDWLNNWTINRCVIATNGYGLQANKVKGRSTITHNTIVGNAGGGVIDLVRDGLSPAWGDTAVTFTDNLVAPWDSPLPIPPSSVAGPCLVRADAAAFDSSTSMHAQKKFVSHHNAYAIAPYSSNVGDRSISIRNGPTAFLYSRPGDSTATTGGLAENRWNLDTLSVYGDAVFAKGAADSVKGLTFNPALGVGSVAIAAGTSGSDIGAISSIAAGQAVTFPTAIVFHVGIADTVIVSIYNPGSAQLGFDGSGAQGFLDRSLPGVTEDCSESDIDIGDTYTFDVLYDGSQTYGSSVIYIMLEDPSLPLIVGPAGAGRYLKIPVTVN